MVSEIEEIDLGGTDDKIWQWPMGILLVGSSEPRIIAITRILRAIIAACKRGPIMGTECALKPIVGDLTCHPEQLLILGHCHGGNHFFHVGIARNFCVKPHELPDTPRSTAQSGSVVKGERTLEALVLMSTVSTISATLSVTDMRMRGIKPLVGLATEYVAFKQNSWAPVGQKPAPAGLDIEYCPQLSSSDSHPLDDLG